MLGASSSFSGDCSNKKSWRVSIAELPGLADLDRNGTLVDFMKDIAREAGVEVVYDIYPFPRSLVNVSTGRADMHVPLLQMEGDVEPLGDGLIYSDAILFEVPFHIYTKRALKVDERDLFNGSLTIETEAAHSEFFPFPVTGSDCITCSLEKVRLGRIDAFIYAEPPTNEAVRRLGLEQEISRRLYRRYPVRAVLPDTACGRLLNARLTNVVKKARIASADPLFQVRRQRPGGHVLDETIPF